MGDHGLPGTFTCKCGDDWRAQQKVIEQIRFEVEAINPKVETEQFGPYDLYTPGFEDARAAVLAILDAKEVKP